MVTIGPRMEQVMKDKRISLSRLEVMTGINKGTLSKYIQGTSEPRATNIHLIAKALGVDETWLMGFSDTRKKVSPIDWRSIPVFSCLSCGLGTFVDEEPETSVCIPYYMMDPSAEYFANQAEGNSMFPVIKNGDLLIFEKADSIDLGQIGSFSLNGEYYCKRLKKDDEGYYLKSENPSYEDIRISPSDNFRVIGLYKVKISKEQ